MRSCKRSISYVDLGSDVEDSDDEFVHVNSIPPAFQSYLDVCTNNYKTFQRHFITETRNQCRSWVPFSDQRTWPVQMELELKRVIDFKRNATETNGEHYLKAFGYAKRAKRFVYVHKELFDFDPIDKEVDVTALPLEVRNFLYLHLIVVRNANIIEKRRKMRRVQPEAGGITFPTTFPTTDSASDSSSDSASDSDFD